MQYLLVPSRRLQVGVVRARLGFHQQAAVETAASLRMGSKWGAFCQRRFWKGTEATTSDVSSAVVVLLEVASPNLTRRGGGASGSAASQ